MTILERPTTLSVQIPVQLRIAVADDVPKLEWYGQYRHYRNLFRRTFREQQAGRRLILIADVNNFPIGHLFIQFHDRDWDADRAYLYSFRVMEMFRGRGIGTMLLREAEAHIMERDVYIATIAAAQDNPGARRLYERVGYQVYDEDSGSWSYVDHRGRVCHVNEPCWLLEKYLRPG
jgi:ribosomal protein S18 acetylase RimI-like enzyme